MSFVRVLCAILHVFLHSRWNTGYSLTNSALYSGEKVNLYPSQAPSKRRLFKKSWYPPLIYRSLSPATKSGISVKICSLNPNARSAVSQCIEASRFREKFLTVWWAKILSYQPPARVNAVEGNQYFNTWKYDLRFFAYADRVQHVVARVYQGQVTNFATPLGGFARVQFA